MRAVLCKEYGPPESLVIAEVADPTPAPHEVLIDIHAASINFPDTLIIEGKYQFKPPMPFTPGSEAGGVIASVGEKVKNYQVGDRVIASFSHGGFAEKAVADAARIFTMPNNMSFAEGASFPMIYGTSYYGLKQRGQLEAGQTLLVTGAAGGVGFAAVELGKLMGAKVIAAASTDEKCAVAKAAGADITINYSTENLKDRVKEITHGKGVDVCYDPVGGDIFEQCLRSMAWNGRLLVIGFTGGISKPPMNLVLLKSCQIVGVFWGAWVANEPKASQQNFDELFYFFDQGWLKPPVNDQFAFTDYAAALNHLGGRKAKGKVILQVR